MKLKVETIIFKEMMSKAVKGASRNKLIPITELICIKHIADQLILVTTDATNYMYIRQDNVKGEDFYITVSVERLAKLVSKMTSEFISFDFDGSALEVVGNGKYSIAVPLDDDGNVIQFPDPYSKVDNDDITDTIMLTSVKNILATAKSSLAVTMEIPVLTNYYIGEWAIASNSEIITGCDDTLINTPCLFSAELMNLLDVMTEEEISVVVKEDYMLFITSDCVIYSKKLPDVDSYPYEDIKALLLEDYPYSCIVNKIELIALLERISLFVSTYDESIVDIVFKKDELVVSNLEKNSNETLSYNKATNNKEFKCLIDVKSLGAQIGACISDSIEIQYGNDMSIKLVDDDTTKIIALAVEG